MSSTNNQPDTNSNQSSIISDSLLHVLRLHSHLTNRPLPDKYKIHPPVQANIAPIYFHIVPDLERHKKAVTQKFLIVDSPFNGRKFPIIHIIGNRALLYTIQFTSTDISCTCPDNVSVCKHVRFILWISSLPSSGTISIDQIIKHFYKADISRHNLDPTTSLICIACLSMNCNICNNRIITDYLMCDKCNGVSHLSCAEIRKNHRFNITHDILHTNTTKHKLKGRFRQTNASNRICHSCNRPWTPISIPVQNSYNNLRHILQCKGYVLGPVRINSSISSSLGAKNGTKRRNQTIIPMQPKTELKKKSVARKLVYSPSESSTTDSTTHDDIFNSKGPIFDETGKKVSDYL